MRQFILKLIYISLLIFIGQYILGIVLHKIRNELVEEVYPPVKRWKEFYAQPEKSIDMLFLGSSHCYRSFVPNVFDSVLNINSFNLGSSSQSISTSYYILKEALLTQSPKYILLEVYHGSLSMNNNYVNVLHNFPQMHLTKVKYEMLSTVSLGQAIGLSLFPLKSVAVNRDQLIKMQKEFPDLSSTTYYSIYDHKGYVATYKNPDYTFNFNDKSSKVPLPNPEQIRYLKKIAKYCEIRQIQLLLITQPILPAYKKAIKNYDPVYNQINEVSKKIEVPYYDMNKIDPLQDSNFYDTGHLLHKGALQFSSNTASFLKQNDFSNASGK